jgi:DNA-binding CsgD family transcriptional regulator
MAAHLTMEQRQLARRLSAKGLSLREIGCQVGCSHQVIRTVVRRESKYPVPADAWRPRPGRLTLADLEEISLGLRGGLSFTAIAVRLGRSGAANDCRPSRSLRAGNLGGLRPAEPPGAPGCRARLSRHAPKATRPCPPGPGRSLRVLRSTLFWTAGWSGVAAGRLPQWLRTNRHPTSFGRLDR